MVLFKHELPRWQRLLDIVGAIALAAVLFPWFVLAAAVTRLDGPSVLLRQERVGRFGQTFGMWKLRTMHHDAEASTGPVLARIGDRRYIRGGALLRALHLDEVPQLVNVLKGDMSLVGPRPERPIFVREYEQTIPRYGERHQAPPGLTGLAQVQLGYHASSEDKLALDLEYLERRSALLYLGIAVRTPVAVVTQAVRSGRIPEPVEDVVIDLRDVTDGPAEDTIDLTAPTEVEAAGAQ